MMKSVLVTGAGSGFGLSAVLLLAERGFRVFGTVVDSRQRADLSRAAADRGVDVGILEVDVTRPESVAHAVDSVVDACGGIWAVVNNAGLGLRGFFEDLSDAEIRRTFEVNVFGVFAVTRAALPHMRRAGEGRVLIMSSAGGRIAATTLCGYSATKFAVEGFGETLSLEMAPFGVKVSIIEPGLVFTPHFTVHRGQAEAALDPKSPYRTWFVRHERMVDEILKTKRITPDDVAREVHRALAARRPKLRYVVGWRPKLLIALRRHLPDAWFDRLYASLNVRMLTRGDGAPEKPPESQGLSWSERDA